jgi:hypothetical protein
MGHWVFGELGGADARRAPSTAILFTTEQAADGEYAGSDSLVREVLQNAIDARCADGPVRVRMAIHEAHEAPRTERQLQYFVRLQAPLAASGVSLGTSGLPTVPCRFLVCEDFGTRGLDGNPELFSDPARDTPQREDFYWFWRNIGRSGKTGDDLGRWGLGKAVYAAASHVGCMFGLTVRQSDRRRLLMGQTVLQIHKHEGKEYHPEGYWCGAENATGLPLPIENPSDLEEFCREWKLTRGDESGLSVVAPFVPAELKAERLLQAVAVNFFARILRGELVVQIAGNGRGTVTLDQGSIEAECQRIRWDGPVRTKRNASPPIAFAKRCLRTTSHKVSNLLGADVVPSLSESTFKPEDLKQLRRQFASGEFVAVRFRLGLPRKSDGMEIGEFDVFLERTSDGKRCDTFFVREGMTITKPASRAGLRGTRAVVLVDSGPLAELLGDTEGPAHEDWDTSSKRPNTAWESWKGRVKFVRGIVDSLVELLTPPTTTPDFDALSDFFSVDRAAGAQRQRKPGDKGDEPTGMEPVNGHPKWFSISQRSGGFTIGRNTAVELPSDPTLRVAVAYDIPRGNPLKNWNPYDFVFGNTDGALHAIRGGVTGTLREGNVVELKIDEPNFRFSVDGFDEHRDLFIRVDDVSGIEEVVE